MVTEPRPPETVSEPETETSGEGPALATEVHTPSIHDALLETVSPDALGSGASRHESDTDAGETVAADEAVETVASTNDAAEPAPVMQPPAALETADDPVPEIVATAAIALGSVTRTTGAISASDAASFDVIGEITEVNATILAFLRNEGSAAVAHWQTLSGARTPADAIRIQVDEMQRAADASLTCFSVLARRAGRLALGIGRA